MAFIFPGWLSKVLKIVGKITDVLIKGRQAGLYDKSAGPQSLYSESAEVLPVANGMPHTFAAILSVVAGLAVGAAQGLDWSLLASDPKKFASSFLAAFLVSWALYLQRPGQASVMLGSSHDLRAEAQGVSSLKLEVPISTKGGK